MEMSMLRMVGMASVMIRRLGGVRIIFSYCRISFWSIPCLVIRKNSVFYVIRSGNGPSEKEMLR